ncbi:MAG: DsbA family protein [Sphingobium sp.]|nr:DsbA family protein [Sphingobium sp.]
MKKSLALTALTGLSLALAGCGGNKDGASSDVPKVNVGENVPAPAGKAWSDVVTQTADGGYRMGNENAPVKVVEFGSYTCSHCADFAATSADGIKEKVETGKLSFEFRPFVRDPLDMTAALLAGCNGPDTYFALSHELFGYQGQLFEAVKAAGDQAYAQAMAQPPAQRFVAAAGITGLLDFVKQRGLTDEKAKQCLADTKAADTLASHVQQSTTKYNITGTPTILINDKVVENAATWDALKEKLTAMGL